MRKIKDGKHARVLYDSQEWSFNGLTIPDENKHLWYGVNHVQNDHVEKEYSIELRGDYFELKAKSRR